jgi:hypothetical protein
MRTSATAQIKADTLYAAGSVRHNAARVAAKRSERRMKALVTRRVKAGNVQDDGHMEVDSIDLKQGALLIHSSSACLTFLQQLIFGQLGTSPASFVGPFPAHDCLLRPCSLST